MNKMKFTLIPLAFIIVAFSWLNVGCDGSNSEFKEVTIKNELGHYSFEYPSHYNKKVWDNLEFKVPYTHLILEGPVITEEVEIFDPETGDIERVTGERGTSSISVYISNFKIYYGESYSSVDYIERLLEGEAEWENFQLLERSPITVSGVEGELIVYLVDKLMPIPVEDGKNLEYVRAVYFDYNDLTWEIIAKCNEDIQGEVTTHFNHIIETFKILE